MKLEYPFVCPGCGSKGTIELKLEGAKIAPVLKRRKKEEPSTPYFQEMVNHIDEAWSAKKKAKFHWEGRFFKELRGLARTYSPFGIMGLFDLYMQSSDDWVRNTGYSFPAFVSHLPKLLDNPGWKQLKRFYEDRFEIIDPDVKATMAGMVKTADKIGVDHETIDVRN